jgi:hypothetical protein
LFTPNIPYFQALFTNPFFILSRNCGDWIFKEQELANKTYNAISVKWAEEFMNKQLKI